MASVATDNKESWPARLEKLASWRLFLIVGACSEGEQKKFVEHGNLAAVVPAEAQDWTIRHIVRRYWPNIQTVSTVYGSLDSWQNLLDDLGLPAHYLLPLHLLLQADTWRKAKSPKAYAIRSAHREACKMHLPSAHASESFLSNEVLEVFSDRLSFGGLRKGRSGAWRQGPSELVDNGTRVDDEGRPIPDSRIPIYLWRIEDRKLKLDWPKVFRLCRAAGLDEMEIAILDLRRQGWTRESILDATENDADRRESQAAWRRLNSHWSTVQKIFGIEA